MIQSKLSESLRSDLGKLADIASSRKVSQKIELKEGERRHVTIVFLDIQGFTAMSEKLDPEDVQLIIDQSFKILSHEIEKYNGFIEKYEGDRLMALFGSKQASEQDCEQALRAALGMKEKFLDVNRILQERQIKVGIRIGVNTGLVVTGRIGKGRDQDFTVMGDAVNLASRLESNAPPNEILISQEVKKVAGSIFDYESLGEITVKGKAAPLPVFCVKGLNPNRPDRWERSAFSQNAKYVGRDIELDVLRKLWARAKVNPTFASVSISAAAGLGKSRLIHAFLSEHARVKISERSVIQHSAVASLHMIPFQFLTDICQKLLTQAQQFESYAKDPDVRRFSELWQYMAGKSELGESYRLLDPDALQIEINVSLRSLFSFVSRSFREIHQQPWIIFLDDLQWADKNSLDSLKFVFSQPEVIHSPFLVLSFRPEFDIRAILPSTDLTHKEIQLLPLSQNDTLSMVYGALEGLVLSQEDEKILFQKAGGNPFFMEELIQSLIDGHLVVHEKSGWHVKKPLVDVSLPDSLNRMVMSRIDRLEPIQKQYLMAASVVGEHVSKDIIQTVASQMGIQPDIHSDILRVLIDVGLLHDQGEWGAFGPEVSFRHVLTQQVVYSMILNHNKRILHGVVGQAFQTAFGDVAHENATFLFYHFLRAGDFGTAKRLAIQSLEKMLIQHSAKEGLKIISELRSAETEGTEHALDDSTLLLLLESETRFYNFLGSREQEFSTLEQFSNIALDKNSSELKARATILKTNYYLAIGQFKQAEELSTQKISELEQSSHDIFPLREKIRMDLYRYAGMAAYNTAQYDEALIFYSKGLELSKTIGEISTEALFLNAIGLVNFSSGNPKFALKFYEDSYAIAKRTQSLRSQANVRGNMGLVNWSLGEYSKAISQLKESNHIFTDIYFLKGQAATLGNLGVIFHKMGQYSLAVANYFKALELRRKIGDRAGEGFDFVNLGVAYSHMGMFDEALEYLTRAQLIARSVESHYLLAEALNCLSIAYRQLSKKDSTSFEKGEQVAQEALSLSQKHQLVAAQAKARTNLARLYWCQKREDEALQYSESAILLITQKSTTLEGAEEDVLVNHYYILSECGKQEQAREYLNKMLNLVIERSQKIIEPEFRKSFLSDVRQNRYVLAEWKKLNPQWNPPNLENTSLSI